MPPVIDRKKCEICGTCYEICHMDILSFSKKKGPEVIYGEECSYCGACVMDCPTSAISIRYPPAMWLFAKGFEDLQKS